MSLVVFDVDHFKRVNDTLGHQAGDDVLRRVAQVLAAAARDIDLVARYGGEEFTVILPNCTLDDAVRVAERMRSSLSGHPRLEGRHPERRRRRHPQQRGRRGKPDRGRRRGDVHLEAGRS